MLHNTKDIKRAVSHCASIVPTRSHFSELLLLRITTLRSGALQFETMTPELATRVKVAALYPDDHAEQFAFAVLASKLKKLLAAVTDDTIEITPVGDKLRIGKVTVASDIPGHLKDYGGFKNLPATCCADFDAKMASADVARTITSRPFDGFDTLKRLLVAASTDETRFNIIGVFIDTAKSRAAATDGHRLHLEDISSWSIARGTPEAIWPSLAIETMLAARQFSKGWTLHLTQDQHLIRLLADNNLCEITFKAIDGQFPDISQVIPARSHRQVWIGADDTGRLIKSLKECEALAKTAGDNCPTLVFQFTQANGYTDLSYSNDIGDWQDRVRCESAYNLTVGLQPRYLREYLEAVESKGNITIDLPEHSLGPVRVFSNTMEAVVMPIRVYDSGQDYGGKPGWEYYFPTLEHAQKALATEVTA